MLNYTHNFCYRFDQQAIGSVPRDTFYKVIGYNQPVDLVLPPPTSRHSNNSKRCEHKPTPAGSSAARCRVITPDAAAGRCGGPAQVLEQPPTPLVKNGSRMATVSCCRSYDYTHIGGRSHKKSNFPKRFRRFTRLFNINNVINLIQLV